MFALLALSAVRGRCLVCWFGLVGVVSVCVLRDLIAKDDPELLNLLLPPPPKCTCFKSGLPRNRIGHKTLLEIYFYFPG